MNVLGRKVPRQSRKKRQRKTWLLNLANTAGKDNQCKLPGRLDRPKSKFSASRDKKKMTWNIPRSPLGALALRNVRWADNSTEFQALTSEINFGENSPVHNLLGRENTRELEEKRLFSKTKETSLQHTRGNQVNRKINFLSMQRHANVERFTEPEQKRKAMSDGHVSSQNSGGKSMGEIHDRNDEQSNTEANAIFPPKTQDQVNSNNSHSVQLTPSKTTKVRHIERKKCEDNIGSESHSILMKWGRLVSQIMQMHSKCQIERHVHIKQQYNNVSQKKRLYLDSIEAKMISLCSMPNEQTTLCWERRANSPKPEPADSLVTMTLSHASSHIDKISGADSCSNISYSQNQTIYQLTDKQTEVATPESTIASIESDTLSDESTISDSVLDSTPVNYVLDLGHESDSTSYSNASFDEDGRQEQLHHDSTKYKISIINKDNYPCQEGGFQYNDARTGNDPDNCFKDQVSDIKCGKNPDTTITTEGAHHGPSAHEERAITRHLPSSDSSCNRTTSSKGQIQSCNAQMRDKAAILLEKCVIVSVDPAPLEPHILRERQKKNHSRKLDFAVSSSINSSCSPIEEHNSPIDVNQRPLRRSKRKRRTASHEFWKLPPRIRSEVAIKCSHQQSQSPVKLASVGTALKTRKLAKRVSKRKKAVRKRIGNCSDALKDSDVRVDGMSRHLEVNYGTGIHSNDSYACGKTPFPRCSLQSLSVPP